MSTKPGLAQLSGFGAIASLFRPHGNRDLFPHFKTHLEVFGDLIQVVSKLIRGWRAVKRGVIADRAKARLTVVKVLAVLAQTLVLLAYFFR
ncbi:MAG: hypothetical protein OEV99_11160 [Nitrospira sp.]|nr:hypothetical protein [Nitrospira sp.]MDH4370391.1 hypothetical protein [Nitrospira sp.]MDH5497965.1 hypothetical protein [Nitrospira sp.]